MFNYTFHWRQALQKLPLLLDGALVTLADRPPVDGDGHCHCGDPRCGAQFEIRVWVRAPATAWVEMARNTPALFQIYMAHFGLGSVSAFISAPMSRLLAGITFNNAGYLAENVSRRAARHSRIRRSRAARSLGMTQVQAFRLIDHAADVAHRVSADHQPDGLGHPDDIARRDRRDEHRSCRGDAGYQCPQLPHLRDSSPLRQ